MGAIIGIFTILLVVFVLLMPVFLILAVAGNVTKKRKAAEKAERERQELLEAIRGSKSS